MRSLVIVTFAVLYSASCYADDIVCYPSFDISGKVLKENGEQFKDDVMICIMNRYREKGSIQYKEHIDYINTSDGTFKWVGRVDGSVVITAEKDNYLSSKVILCGYYEKYNNIKDITIYMVQKGIPTPLEVTLQAFIPDYNDFEANGKICGWSFSKRQYFPAGEEVIDMSLGCNKKGQYIYRMKPPGGFVHFPGFRYFESDERNIDNGFEYLIEAPEYGYVSDFIQDDHPIARDGWSYCYFRTPKGLYGKIRFKAREFDYLVQPNGSRNLAEGELIHKDPVHPVKSQRDEKNKNLKNYF